MSNVVRLPRRGLTDEQVTEVIDMVNPTPPHGIPFQTLLAGPASDPEAHQVRHPRPFALPFWTHTATYFIGVAQALLIVRWF